MGSGAHIQLDCSQPAHEQGLRAQSPDKRDADRGSDGALAARASRARELIWLPRCETGGPSQAREQQDLARFFSLFCSSKTQSESLFWKAARGYWRFQCMPDLSRNVRVIANATIVT